MKKILLFCIVAFASLLTNQYANAQFANSVQMPEMRDPHFSDLPDFGRHVMSFKVISSALEGNILGDSPERNVSVYLPPGYDDVKDRYPVIYLLGEYATDHAFWFGGYDALLYNLTGVLDNLIINGKINPVIVVSPNNLNIYKGSWFTNSEISGNWEDYNVNDIIKFIDNNFRTISRPESRGIAGWSMGGYGALKLAMKHPDIFSSVYSISGALLDFQHRMINYEPERNDLMKAAKVTNENFSLSSNLLYCFSQAIAFAPNSNAIGLGDLPYDMNGEFREDIWQKWLAHNLITQTPSNKDNLLKLRAIALEFGTGETPVYNENVSFSDALNANNVEHSIHIHNGDYHYTIFNGMDKRVFPFFSANLENHFITTNKILLCEIDTLNVKMFNTSGTLYIAPLSTALEIAEIEDQKLFSCKTGPLESVDVFTKDLAPGSYVAIGITDNGFITVPERFSVTNEIPVMTIRVTEKHSGEPVSACRIFINAKEFKTNEQGEVTMDGCGKRLILINEPGFMNCSATAMVYSDTLISMEIVKESFVKVVDKATGKPVYRASLNYCNRKAGTDKFGIAAIKVMSGENIMTFQVSHPEYFDLTCSIAPVYKETVTIELTRKLAYVCFLVEDGAGPLAGQKVDFCSSTLTTNSLGIVKFSGRPARNEYTYKVKRNGFVPVEEVFFLEKDTLIKVKLFAEVNQVESALKASENSDNATSADALRTGINPEMDVVLNVFPNPVKDILYITTSSGPNLSVKVLSVNGESILNKSMEGDNLQIDMSQYKPGVYVIVVNSANQVITRKVIKL